jgi:hypothetical protein
MRSSHFIQGKYDTNKTLMNARKLYLSTYYIYKVTEIKLHSIGDAW